MSAASGFYPLDRTNVFYNLQDWQAMLGEIVESNAQWADSISQVLYKTISTLQEPDRVQETIDTLKLGLEWIFPYTITHRLSFTLFLLEAEGVLKESESLETLLNAAIERANEKASFETEETGSGELAGGGRGLSGESRGREEAGRMPGVPGGPGGQGAGRMPALPGLPGGLGGRGEAGRMPALPGLPGKFYPFDRTKVFYNQEDWRARLGKIVESNPEAADSIAQVLYEMISTLSEPGRVQETIDTLKLGLEWIFPYTSTRALSFTLFLFEAEGILKEPDTLETLLDAALDRALAKAEASLGAQESRATGERNANPGSKAGHPKPKRGKSNRAKNEAKRKHRTARQGKV